MRQKIQLGLRKPRPKQIAFFRQDPKNRALREAEVRFQVTYAQMAELIGISSTGYWNLSTGVTPVSKRLAPYVETISQAKSWKELEEKIGELRREEEFTKVGPVPAKSGGDADPRLFKEYVDQWSPSILRMTRKAVRRVGLSETIADEIADDCLMAMRRFLEREGQIQNKKTFHHWLAGTVHHLVFDRVLVERGFSRQESRFYFRMRRLMTVHQTRTGQDFTPENLMAVDDRLSREEAEASLAKCQQLAQIFRRIEISVEDLDNRFSRE